MWFWVTFQICQCNFNFQSGNKRGETNNDIEIIYATLIHVDSSSHLDTATHTTFHSFPIETNITQSRNLLLYFISFSFFSFSNQTTFYLPCISTSGISLFSIVFEKKKKRKQRDKKEKRGGTKIVAIRDDRANNWLKRFQRPLIYFDILLSPVLATGKAFLDRTSFPF